MTTPPTGNLNQSVVVVIPVYLGEQSTRDCLESVIRSELPENVSVLIIDDCSPEPAIRALCHDTANQHGFELLRNSENLGFVATVNRGFEFDTNADVILLNSDTEVSGNWIHRLQACAYRRDKIGTVTPFSNNGTICSYPVVMDSCDLPPGWTAGELDELFQSSNAQADAIIPTAVGFCMYIRRACLTEIGPFDEENFGHGYGEECDFSQRAVTAGWENVIAADTFIYHMGGASFANETQARKENADKIIAKLHPKYNGRVLQFLQDDPLLHFRHAVDTARLELKADEAIQLITERERHVQLTLERSASLLGELLEEQTQRREELKQRQALETLLQESRNQFTQTDQALSNAQGHVDNLNATIARLNKEFDTAIEDCKKIIENCNAEITTLNTAIADRDATLKGKYLEVDQLRETIRAMEQSRSWRYTTWLRGSEGLHAKES